MDGFYKILWNTHGFKARNLPEEEFRKLTEEFLRLRDEFGRFANSPDGYERFNAEFEAFYPAINDLSTENVDHYTYGSFLAWRMNDAIRAKMLKDPGFLKSELLEPFIFMDGTTPDLGVRLRNHGNWTMDMLLKVVD